MSCRTRSRCRRRPVGKRNNDERLAPRLRRKDRISEVPKPSAFFSNPLKLEDVQPGLTRLFRWKRLTTSPARDPALSAAYGTLKWIDDLLYPRILHDSSMRITATTECRSCPVFLFANSASLELLIDIVRRAPRRTEENRGKAPFVAASPGSIRPLCIDHFGPTILLFFCNIMVPVPIKKELPFMPTVLQLFAATRDLL